MAQAHNHQTDLKGRSNMFLMAPFVVFRPQVVRIRHHRLNAKALHHRPWVQAHNHQADLDHKPKFQMAPITLSLACFATIVEHLSKDVAQAIQFLERKANANVNANVLAKVEDQVCRLILDMLVNLVLVLEAHVVVVVPFLDAKVKANVDVQVCRLTSDTLVNLVPVAEAQVVEVDPSVLERKANANANANVLVKVEVQVCRLITDMLVDPFLDKTNATTVVALDATLDVAKVDLLMDATEAVTEVNSSMAKILAWFYAKCKVVLVQELPQLLAKTEVQPILA